MNSELSILFLALTAAISLANWSTNEENAAIQDTCNRMYELSMLLSSAIDLFSKEVSIYEFRIFADVLFILT